MRVLSISTLFPNPAVPGLGPFVASQMKAVAACDEVDLVMVNPLGVPPWPLSLHPHYAALRAVGPSSALGALAVHHPRFALIPRFGGQTNAGRIARAVLPLARRLHAETPFDLVDAQFFFPDGPAAAIVAKALGLPLTIKARGADIHYWGRLRGSGPQMLRAARQAAGLLAVSQAMKADMAALGIDAGKIAVHYTGLDHDRFRPLERAACRREIAGSFGVPETGRLLVATGALIARKGQGLAIEALPALPQARLALAGQGADEANLRALAKRLDVSDRVHFLGRVGHDDLPTLLSAADALILPSASEGLANAWIEALACGTPLVVPDVGGAREVVQDGSAGRIVAREADAIAAGVRDLLAAPPSQAAVAPHAERFSWDHNARELAAFWRRMARR